MVQTEMVLEQVAENNGVSVKEVKEAIEMAIGEAMDNSNSTAQLFWSQIPRVGERPTATELVKYIVELL